MEAVVNLHLTSTTTESIASSVTGESLTDELLSPNSYTFYGETTVVTLLLLIGSALNGPLLYVYYTSSQARSIADKFLINLILADILSLVLLLPTIIVDLFLLERNEESLLRNMTLFAEDIGEFSNSNVFAVHGPEPGTISIQLYTVNGFLNDTGADASAADVGVVFETWDWSCTFKKCLFSGLATASILSTLEIAMERYLAIVTPLHYHKFLTKYKVWMTSFGGGLIAIGSAVLSALDPCEPVFPSCTRTTISYTASFWWPLYTLGHVTLFFILPVLCMAGIYIKIWLEARRQKAKISQQYKRPFFLHVTPSNPTGNDLKERPKFFLHPVVLRFRFIDRFVTARMDRAARVAICTLMVTIICWSPYYFVQCAHSIRSIMEQLKGQVRVRESWSHLESTVPLLAASLHPVLAPFFYGYRYTIIRDRVFLLLKLDRWYPVIRERRSNSVSQYRSPARSVKKVNDTMEGVLAQDGQQQCGPVGNNFGQWKNSSETNGVKCDSDHMVITIQGPEEEQRQNAEPGPARRPPHPFLFTIGACDDDEDQAAMCDAREAFGSRYRNYNDQNRRPTAYEYGSDSNCSSSDALLTPHHFLYDDSNTPNYCGSVCYGGCGGSSLNSSTSTSSNSSRKPSLLPMDSRPTVPEIGPVGKTQCWTMWSKLIQQMIHYYTQRWGKHRQSVSSNSSVVTLLSSRSISSDCLPS